MEWKKLVSASNRSRVIRELRRRTRDDVPTISRDSSAVLVPILPGNGTGPAMLFTVRSRNLKNHRGQVRYALSVYVVNSVWPCLRKSLFYHFAILN